MTPTTNNIDRHGIKFSELSKYQFHHRLVEPLLQFSVLLLQLRVAFVQSCLGQLKMIHCIVVGRSMLSRVAELIPKFGNFLRQQRCFLQKPSTDALQYLYLLVKYMLSRINSDLVARRKWLNAYINMQQWLEFYLG